MDTAASPQAGGAKVIGKIADFFENVSIVAMAAVAVLVLAQIVLRTFFSLAYAGIEELARFAHVNLVFLLIPMLFRDGAHINVDLLIQRVSPAARRVLALLAALLTALYGAIFLASEYQFMMRNGSVSTPALRIPNWFFFAGAYIGMAFLLVTACEKFVVELKKR